MATANDLARLSSQYLHPSGKSPEQIGAELNAGLLLRCAVARTIGGRRWVCVTAVHDDVPGRGYGRAESHRFLPTKPKPDAE